MNRLKCLAIFAALTAAQCFPQTPEPKPEEPAKYFRLDFTVKELEGGKVVSSRSYFTSASTQRDGGCLMRSGDKIPTQTGDKTFTYLDVGVSIDCNSLKLVDSQLSLHINADVSGPITAPESGVSSPPLIRQNKWNAVVLIPLRKQVTIFSSDGASTKRQMQMELTATPIP